MYVCAVESLQRQWYTGVKHIRIELPKYVAFIIDKLYENGYEAFAVGGCIRDAMMGRTPHDWDITTSALPKEVKAIFNKTIDTGIKHGTVTVMIKGVGYEVTTYRIDGEYTDGRHPNEVLFTSNLSEDLKRRDFTINAMAYNNKTGVIDLFGGTDDIVHKRIRCVGEATERFSEDALRILRGIRFSAQLNFDIDETTYSAIYKLSDNLAQISRERIQEEMTKLITSPRPDKIMDIYKLSLGKYVFADTLLAKASDDSLYRKVSDIMLDLPPFHYLRYAGLLTFESNADVVLRALKFDNKTIKNVAKLVNNKDYPLSTNEADVRRSIVAIGKDIYKEYYLEYIKALIKHKVITNVSLSDVDKITEIYEDIISSNQCICMADMAIHGRELKELGLPDGKLIGDILNNLFLKILDNPELNNKETLLELAQEIIDEHNQI